MNRTPDFKNIASVIFKYRILLLAALSIITLFLAYQASRLEVATDFSRMVPREHEYIKDYAPFKEVFGGGNHLKIEVSLRDGDIVSTDFLRLLRKINEDVMFVKGVDRLKVQSLVSPETKYLIINEEGFDMGPIVPERIPETEEGLARVRENINIARLQGRLVSMDMKSVLISAEIYETGVDYLSVYRQLNNIRDKYSGENISIHINGFAMVMGFVNDAMPKIIALFILTTLITFIILWRYFRRLKLAVLPLAFGGVAVLWSLGISGMIGMKLDPMTTIVPFLVFAIGVSHGIQMIKRYIEECGIHSAGYDAALHSLAGLLLPGSVALITDVIGFITIMFVPIGVIQDLAVIASIGVACIIIANLVALTLVLSYYPNVVMCEATKEQESSFIFRALKSVSRLTYGENAKVTVVVSVILFLIGIFTARTMKVGDVNPGEPLLWEDSTYNQDAARIMKDFMFGIDSMSVVVDGVEEGTCKQYDVLRIMDEFEWEMGKIPGVTFIFSPLLIAKFVNEMLHEGNVRWRELPKGRRELGLIMATAGSTDDSEFMSMGCEFMNIRIYLSDHKGETIRRVIKRAKQFIAENPLPNGARFVLAGGNAGVMAATNEVVDSAQVPMLVFIYLSIFILCVIVFRRLRAPFFIISPLLVVSVLATAFMKLFGLGLNVNTLPVATLGVGIGVDYGIYIYSRLREELLRTDNFGEAVTRTLQTTGTAVLYTAITLSVGVLTWLLSDLKFQADMGLLLGFIFIANMVGAMILLPALVYIFGYKKAK